MVPDLHGRLAGVGQGCPQKMSLLPVRPHRVHSETSCRCSCGADLLHSSCSAARIRPHPATLSPCKLNTCCTSGRCGAPDQPEAAVQPGKAKAGVAYPVPAILAGSHQLGRKLHSTCLLLALHTVQLECLCVVLTSPHLIAACYPLPAVTAHIPLAGALHIIPSCVKSSNMLCCRAPAKLRNCWTSMSSGVGCHCAREPNSWCSMLTRKGVLLRKNSTVHLLVSALGSAANQLAADASSYHTLCYIHRLAGGCNGILLRRPCRACRLHCTAGKQCVPLACASCEGCQDVVQPHEPLAAQLFLPPQLPV